MAVVGGPAVRRSAADPYGAYNFVVELGGILTAGFMEVGGLQSEVEVTDYREGGNNEFAHKIIGPAAYPSNLTLKRGYTRSTQLWEWHTLTLAGLGERLTISVLLRNAAGDPKWRWTFRDCQPVKWIGPALRAASAEVAIETLELAHHGLLLSQSGRR